MSRGDYAPDQDGVVAEILRHLAEIGAGRTSITDDDLANAPTDVMRELLVGLLTLHEDLQYSRACEPSRSSSPTGWSQTCAPR